MKLALLVLAHTDAVQLTNLVKRLKPNDYFDTHIFIHIDAKADISLFKNLKEYDYVTFTKKRLNVVRCGISQVDAEIQLIKTALEHNGDFDKYIMITGQDYPIVDNQTIANTLNSNIEFMRAYKVTNTIMNKKVTKYYFYNKYFSGNKFKDLARKCIQTIFKCLSKKDYLVFQKRKYDIYYGSAYFAVSSELIKYIYDIGSNKQYRKYFKNAICSDEMYFITIAANSKFKNKLQVVENKSNTLLDNSAITYFEYKDRPIVFNQDDYERLLKSSEGRIFARKFSSKESSQLIKMLQKGND